MSALAAIVLAEPGPAPMSPEEHRMWAGVSLCLSLYLPAYVLFKVRPPYSAVEDEGSRQLSPLA